MFQGPALVVDRYGAVELLSDGDFGPWRRDCSVLVDLVNARAVGDRPVVLDGADALEG